MAKKYFGQVGRLLPEKADYYSEIHLNPWPELLALLKAYHHENYSIFRLGNEVFSYFEYSGDDFDGDMAKMAEEPLMQKWWTHSKPCFERFAMDEGAEFYADMERIFFLP